MQFFCLLSCRCCDSSVFVLIAAFWIPSFLPDLPKFLSLSLSPRWLPLSAAPQHCLLRQQKSIKEGLKKKIMKDDLQIRASSKSCTLDASGSVHCCDFFRLSQAFALGDKVLLRGSSECSHSDRTVSAEPKWVKSLFEVQALVLPCRKWTGSQATVIIPLPNVWLLLRRLDHIKSQDLLGNGQNESPLQDCLDQGSRFV